MSVLLLVVAAVCIHCTTGSIDVFNVTVDVWVDPVTGDDTQSGLKSSLPVRTLARASEMAALGSMAQTTVHMASGSYANVTHDCGARFVSDAGALTLSAAAGATVHCPNAPGLQLVVHGDIVLDNLAVSGATVPLLLNATTAASRVHLRDVSVRSGVGFSSILAAGSGHVTLENSEWTDCEQGGLLVDDAASFNATHTSFRRNELALLLKVHHSTALHNCTFEENRASPNALHNVASVRFEAPSADSTLFVESTTFDGDNGTSIETSAVMIARTDVRNVTFRNSARPAQLFHAGNIHFNGGE